MKKFPVIFLILIVIIAVICASILSIYFYKEPVKISSGSKYKQTWNQSSLGSLQVNENVIGYTLTKLETNDLHNPPLSKETPKIEVIIDDKIYSAEIVKGSIDVNEGQIDNEDIKISMTRQDVINILNSTSSSDAISKSINEGTMQFEIVASKTELFSKGYLSLYKKFTGK
jgi:heme/copper-type cytochrome/quinol oxidase subunit 2